MKKAYSFDAEKHLHMIGCEIVPGITGVIKPLTDYGSINPDVLQAACDWGTNVHKAVELHLTDSLDVESLDDPLRRTIETFDFWLEKTGINKHDFIAEIPMGDATLKYGGIPDLILDGKLIVEIKTRPVNLLTDGLQTAAQEKLWIKNGGKRVWSYERRVLHLTPDVYHYQVVNGNDDWSRFRLLLDHYWNTKTIQSWKDNK